MARAYIDVVRIESGDRLAGAYLKGSVMKSWDSLIDYAPTISDVDVHLRLASHASRSHFDAPDVAVRVSRDALDLFHSRVPDPQHVPRPQVMFLDDLMSKEGYLPSPANCVETLLGEAYPSVTPDEYAAAADVDRARFLDDANHVMRELPNRVFDRPGAHLWWAVIPSLAWRVAPAGPRLLTMLGVHPWEAWQMNRTSIVEKLHELGRGELGGHYAAFYLAAWEGFRSGFTDSSAAYQAVEAVNHLFDLGALVP